jgi:hypothetical protein
VKHVAFEWNGGQRCERCFRWQDPDDGLACDLLMVDAWEIALSHPGGYGRDKHLRCIRCGDELPASAAAGEPVATTVFRQDSHSAVLLLSASYERYRLEGSPRCTGLGGSPTTTTPAPFPSVSASLAG